MEREGTAKAVHQKRSDGPPFWIHDVSIYLSIYLSIYRSSRFGPDFSIICLSASSQSRMNIGRNRTHARRTSVPAGRQMPPLANPTTAASVSLEVDGGEPTKRNGSIWSSARILLAMVFIAFTFGLAGVVVGATNGTALTGRLSDLESKVDALQATSAHTHDEASAHTHPHTHTRLPSTVPSTVPTPTVQRYLQRYLQRCLQRRPPTSTRAGARSRTISEK